MTRSPAQERAQFERSRAGGLAKAEQARKRREAEIDRKAAEVERVLCDMCRGRGSIPSPAPLRSMMKCPKCTRQE